MGRIIRASARNVDDYYELFVNRLAYTLQSAVPNTNGRHWYYRPKDKRTKRNVSLSVQTVKKHLEGAITIGLYSTNPKTQRCKWIAIDADYPGSMEDLVRLQGELKADGVHSALEPSRRGGHLWLFGKNPLLACDCRLYISHVAGRLALPIKGQLLPNLQTVKEGIEIFPKQDQVTSASFGNGLRGPLGVHRATATRYWFYDALCTLDEQLRYLKDLPKLTEEQLSNFVAGIPKPQPHTHPPVPARQSSRWSGREFRILDYIGRKKRRGTNFFARCPSCAVAGKDTGSDNLAISVSDPRLYKCWAGCSKHEIRAALGQPIRNRMAS
jgi:hypothetical protein